MRLKDIHRTQKRSFKAFCEDSVDMSRPNHVRGEIYTEMFDSEFPR